MYRSAQHDMIRNYLWLKSLAKRFIIYHIFLKPPPQVGGLARDPYQLFFFLNSQKPEI